MDQRRPGALRESGLLAASQLPRVRAAAHYSHPALAGACQGHRLLPGRQDSLAEFSMERRPHMTTAFGRGYHVAHARENPQGEPSAESVTAAEVPFPVWKAAGREGVGGSPRARGDGDARRFLDTALRPRARPRRGGQGGGARVRRHAPARLGKAATMNNA